MYTCASFFAGVGGIDLGFEQTGKFKVVYANEIDPYPVQTYELNSNLKVDNRSICNVQPSEIPDFDVMIAGFPCTDISIAGLRKGLYNEDGTLTRSGLFFELTRIIHAKKPKVVFLENVKNLTTHNNGITFSAVTGALTQAGYTPVFSKVMNAMDYGNIPQNRERIYIVAFRQDIAPSEFCFPEPIPLTTSLHDIIDFHTKMDEKYYYTPEKCSFYPTLEKEMKNKDSIYQWRRKYVRENKSGVCPTLTANMGTGGHNVPLILTDNGIRKLTPRETFNLQGFPEDFVLPKDMSDARLYKCAGNSVVVPVIQRIAENIYNSRK